MFRYALEELVKMLVIYNQLMEDGVHLDHTVNVVDHVSLEWGSGRDSVTTQREYKYIYPKMVYNIVLLF